jgi:hypothetical protein
MVLGGGGGGCILRRSQIGDPPQEDLVKFGYRPYIKVIKKRILLYFGYLLEPIVEIWWFQK